MTSCVCGVLACYWIGASVNRRFGLEVNKCGRIRRSEGIVPLGPLRPCMSMRSRYMSSARPRSDAERRGGKAVSRPQRYSSVGRLARHLANGMGREIASKLARKRPASSRLIPAVSP